MNDDLLRERARSRSRSKSLTRVASNMSIGKLFARSRSSSPSRRSSTTSSTRTTTTDDDDDDDDQDESCAQPPPDPIFKVATVNKHTGNEFRVPQYSPPPPGSSVGSNDYYAATTAAAAYANKHNGTQPHYRYKNNNPLPPNEIFVRDDHSFMDSFHDHVVQPQQQTQQQQQQQDILYGGLTNHYQDNVPYHRPSVSTGRHGQQGSLSSFDAMLFSSSSSSPEIPTTTTSMSRSSNNSSLASSETIMDRYLLPTATRGSDSLSSNTSSSIRSYFDEFLVTPSPSTSYRVLGASTHNNNFCGSSGPQQQKSNSYDEKIMSTIDGSTTTTRRSTSSRRAPLHPSFYSHPGSQQQPPLLEHRAHTAPDMVSDNFSQLKDDVNGLIDDLIQSQQQLRSQQDMGRYYNSTYESVQGLRAVSLLYSLLL